MAMFRARALTKTAPIMKWTIDIPASYTLRDVSGGAPQARDGDVPAEVNDGMMVCCKIKEMVF
jgi:hypothetical protein